MKFQTLFIASFLLIVASCNSQSEQNTPEEVNVIVDSDVFFDETEISPTVLNKMPEYSPRDIHAPTQYSVHVNIRNNPNSTFCEIYKGDMEIILREVFSGETDYNPYANRAVYKGTNSNDYKIDRLSDETYTIVVGEFINSSRPKNGRFTVFTFNPRYKYQIDIDY